MLNKIWSVCFVLLILSVAAYADTTPAANCTPFPVTFALSAGGPSPVSCPAFSVPGATLTGVTLSYVADYQFGTASSVSIQVTFTPAGPAGVTWAPPSVALIQTGGAGSNNPLPMGSASTTAGVSTAAFSAAFNVSVSSAVVTGGAATSSGAVTVVYTYTPPAALTLACPATTGTVGTLYSSALVASGGVPAYGPYVLLTGSISPLALNPSTGAITGTPTVAGPLTFTAQVTDSVATTATTPAGGCTITIANTPPPPPPPPGVCNASSPVFSAGVAGAFQIRYAANLNVGDSFVDLTNTGSQLDTNGNSSNLCANVYTFDPAEELISCCACLVTPNGLQSLSVLQSLISNPLTPAVPTSVVVKIVATVPSTGALGTGLLAWGTTLHALPSGYGLTEGPFGTSTLKNPELTHITSTCGFIQANGSGFGICKGCSAGGLGATSVSQ